MVTWPKVKLGDCVNLLAGFPFKSQQFTDNPDGVHLVKGENVSQGCILWAISKRWPAADWEKMAKFHLLPGDVIVAMDRPWIPAGLKWSFIRASDPKSLLVQRCARLRSNNGSLDQNFLRFVIGGPAFKNYVIPITTGVNVPHISGQQILDFEFILPPLPVQHRIAGILSAYDELIENCQRRIKILEQMARNLYREWFVHFRFPNHAKTPMVDSPLGRIPKGWDVKQFGEVANITMGLSPKGDTYNEDGDGTPLVNGPVEFGERFTKQVKWTTSPTKFCKDGDLVVCVRGSTTGKYVKSDGVYCLGRGVCGISSKYQSFADLLFENELHSLLGQTSGSTFPSWTGPQLKNHPVVFPPQELLIHFDRLTKPISAATLAYSRQIENLRKTRDLLLPRLMSGRVSEAIGI